MPDVKHYNYGNEMPSLLKTTIIIFSEVWALFTYPISHICGLTLGIHEPNKK